MTTFTRTVTIRWRDVDAYGHVSHSVFLTYLEEGRDAFMREVLGGEPAYVMARVELDYLAEIRQHHGHVDAAIAVEKVGTTSLTTHETLTLPDGTVAARARVVGVHWDRDAWTKRPFTDGQRSALLAHEVSRR